MGFSNSLRDQESYLELYEEVKSMVERYKDRRGVVLAKEDLRELSSEIRPWRGYLRGVRIFCSQHPQACKLPWLEQTESLVNQLISRVEGLVEREGAIEASDLLELLISIKQALDAIPYDLGVVPPPTPPQHVHVRVEVGSESFVVSPPFVIGRYDSSRDGPGFPPDVLAIKPHGAEGRVLYAFKGTKCRYGCSPGDLDCTSRRHLEVNFDIRKGVLLLKHIGSTVTYYGNQFGEQMLSVLEIPPGSEVALWLGGLYSTSGRRVPVIIRFVDLTGYSREESVSTRITRLR